MLQPTTSVEEKNEEDEKKTGPEERPTVLLLHANAGNVGHRLPIAKIFYMNMKCNVLALSYRGYGLSEGTANEAGLRLDAQTALDYILSHPVIDRTKIFIYGQSIGGAVAIDLASHNGQRIHGLVIENTFLSLPKLVPSVMPFAKHFLFLLHQIWPSETSITKLPASLPALFLSGGADELIPPAHMKRLFEVCSSTKKEWRDFPKGSHNDTCLQPSYFSDISTFISSHFRPPIPAVVPRPQSPLTPTTPPSPPLPSIPSSESSTSDMEGSFELINKEEDHDLSEMGKGSVGPKVVVEEKIKEAEERIKEVEERIKSEL